MIKKISQTGSTLMEVVVVTAILSTVSLAFLGTFATVSKFHEKNMRVIKAGLLAEEGIEAIRILKSQDFNALSTLAQAGATPHYLAVSTSTWSITSTPEVIDGIYYRYFTLTPAKRTPTYDIVYGAGTASDTVDLNTLFIDVYVEWQWRNATNTNIYKAFITNI